MLIYINDIVDISGENKMDRKLSNGELREETGTVSNCSRSREDELYVYNNEWPRAQSCQRPSYYGVQYLVTASAIIGTNRCHRSVSSNNAVPLCRDWYSHERYRVAGNEASDEEWRWTEMQETAGGRARMGRLRWT
jgi:hypothetical protein